jgi:phosphoglucomutase
MEEVRKICSIDNVKFTRNDPVIQYIGKEIDEVYLEKLKTLSLCPDSIEKQADLHIVYSPLHGTGVELIPKGLRKFGFKNIHLVEKQAVSDGNFPTVVSPNPEEKEALSMALEQAKSTNADLVMATDPDGDRVGIAVKDNKGEFVLLNGNMTAALIVYYMCKMLHESGKITEKQYIVKTIVTTELLVEIARKYGVDSYDVLTGFKYIADKIRTLESEKEFVCGGEESYGYLVGDFVRDKDAVISCCIIAEIAAWAKEQHKSLFDILTDIYIAFGYYKEHLLSLTKKGQNGAMEIKQMMNTYRNNPPKTINGMKVTQINDYLLSVSKNPATNTEEKIDLPVSDVLQFFLEDESKITVRPSGTEPKIKFYFGVKTKLANKNDLDKTSLLLNNKLEAIIADMGLKK